MPYKDDFLDGVVVPMPTLLPGTEAVALNGGAPIEHTNHSIVFNRERKLATFAAHNVQSPAVNLPRRHFTFDPLVDNALQIDNAQGYLNNPWDAGHLARRVDVHWPDLATAEQAEIDTSRWTNIAPQHADLNQKSWRKIEDWLLGLADGNAKKLSVFTGPVFTVTDLEWTNDPGEEPIRIPSGYWKVAVLKHGGELKAAAFLIWQTDVHPSPDDFDPDDFNPILEQVRVLTIEHLAGLSFGDLVRNADPLRFGAELTSPTSPTGFNTGGVDGTPARDRPTTTVAAVTVSDASDIQL